MGQNVNNNNNENGLNRLIGQIAAEKKKTVMALCLLGMMVFMWVKVLGGKGPQTAGAEQVVAEAAKEQQEPELKLTFVELPKIKGRNDVLSRDFFTANSDAFGYTKEVNVSSNEGSEELANQISQRLKLQVIEMGEKPKVFINDKLLSAGDKLVVGSEAEYECEIIEIEKNSVLVGCGNARVTLKLARTAEDD